MLRNLLVVLVGLALVVSGGCADGSGESTVAVELSEHEVVTNPDSVEAGEVTFEVENTGEETHEFVIVSTDLDASELPRASDKSFDEEGEGVEVVDEIEDIEAGQSEVLTVDLEAGPYVLACNVVEEEEEDGETVDEAHYDLGMYTEFEVS